MSAGFAETGIFRRPVPAMPTLPPVDLGAQALVVTALEDEAPGVRTFRFEADGGGRFRFLPGQAITLGLDIEGSRQWRTFTIASSPTRPAEIALTVRIKPEGSATSWMRDRLRPGIRVAARGPVGRFSLALHPGPRVLLLSAGSGATPVMSMLRWLADRIETTDVVYVHAARTPDDVLFAAELAELDAAMPNLRVAVVVSRVPAGRSWFGLRGRLDRRSLGALVPDLALREVFCCGPLGFMDLARRVFLAEGGRPERFHTESFGVADAVEPVADSPRRVGEDRTAGTLRIKGRERAIDVEAGETVLAAATRAKVPLPSGCRSGICGTCRVRRISGEAAMAHRGGLTPREEADGWLLACCSRPIDDLEIELDGR